MESLAYILCAVLCIISFIHLGWALGVTWPFKTEKALARAVVGYRDIEKMPPKWASVFVAIWLLCAGVWALELRGIGPAGVSKIVAFLGGTGLSIIFLLRGGLAILPTFERMAPEQPFLRLNRWLYSPLCFLIGVGFALLVLSMPNWGWRLST